MRKVTKILLKALSVTVLFLIFCPILLTVVVELPSVQNLLIRQITNFISNRIDTRVSVGHVRLGALGSLRLDDFYVEDFQQDTLLYVGQLKIYLSRWDDGQGIWLRNGSVKDAYLNLRETPSGDMNIKQVVDTFSKKNREKKSTFALGVEDVRLENVNLVIEQQEHRDPTYGIDYNDMHIEHISAYVDNFTLEGDEVAGYIHNLSLVEHSGFMVQNFTGHFAVARGVIELDDFEIMAERSDVRLPQLTLRGESWADYKDFIHNVQIEGQIYRSTVSSSDIAHFAPGMLDWNLLVRDLNGVVRGTVADLRAVIDNASFGRSSSLTGSVRLRGLPSVRTATMDLNLRRLTTNEADAALVLSSITGRSLPDGVLTMADAAGQIIGSGTFNGGFSRFDSNLTLTTESGNALLTARREPMERITGEPQRSSLEATADLRHIDLGNLLQLPTLGYATASLRFDGSTTSEQIRGRATGIVSDVEFYGTDYQDIEINGTIMNKSFTGSIGSDYEPLRFALSGTADMNGQNSIYDLRLDVEGADLHAMNINQRDSVSMLQMQAEMYMVGRELDDLNGSLTINGGRYRYNADSLQTGPIKLTARNGEQRSLTLTSDFVDASFTGPTSYATVARYLTTAMAKYLPGITANSTYESSEEDEGYSALSVNVKDVDPLLDAISNGLQLAQGSALNFTMNPASNHLMLRAESEYIEQGNMLVTNLNLNITNQGDSLAMYLRSDDLYSGVLHVPHLSVMGGAKNNRVTLSAAFSDQADSLAGFVGLIAKLRRDAITGAPQATISLYPSNLKMDNREWQISSDTIRVDSSRWDVRNLVVASGEQMLRLNGVASRSSEDSLTMYMRDFDINPFMSFAERMGYEVTGRGNGSASIKALMDRGEVTADITIDSMMVNATAVAPLHIVSRWDLDQQRIGLEMNNSRTGSNIVRGYYAPTTKRYYAEGTFSNLPMTMLDPILVSVVSQTQGRADAKLEIMGQGREAKLNGQVEVTDLTTMVDFTRARYSIPKATVTVKDNHFIANDIPIYDTEQNSGSASMDLSLDHLSNIAYTMRVTPRSMIVLNTTQQDNDLFYGKVYASGTANIKGDKSGTTLDLSGTTVGNSQFYMPLSSKSDVASADFVVFEQPGVEMDTTNYLLRKKMAFERRNKPRTASSGSNMSINVELTATPNVEVQLVIDPTVGDIIRARGNGTLNMRIVPNRNIFDMYGDYTITEGSYLFTLQNIINKRFVINSGSTIQWTGDPLDARLNIDAVYSLKASLQPLLSSTTLDNVTRAVPVECMINLTERLTSPTVTFDIKVPNADSEIQNAVSNLLNNQQSIATQFMYLLVSGTFYSDSSTSSSIGASASATTGFELLSNQVSNWLSSDDYNIVLRYRPKSQLTSDEIDFGFSKSLVNDRLIVEVEGNYLVNSRMAHTSKMSNFMGEAYITWLIDQAGNLKLRGFTQTIDRFDENQGLQETGVGIYYKEDFDNWTDLKERIRERFMSKRRRARLEAEQAKRDSLQRVAERDSLRREAETDSLINVLIRRPQTEIENK